MKSLTLFEKIKIWFYFVLPTFFCKHEELLMDKPPNLDFDMHYIECKKCGKLFFFRIRREVNKC